MARGLESGCICNRHEREREREESPSWTYLHSILERVSRTTRMISTHYKRSVFRAKNTHKKKSLSRLFQFVFFDQKKTNKKNSSQK